MTYFQYFGLPQFPSFKIDTRDLRNRFLQAQRICHPDAWAQMGQKEGMLAAAQSSQLNKAYQTLLSPLSRAQYILSLHGHEQEETDSIEDEELIMEIMEARQGVEDAGGTEDIARLRETNQVKLDETINQINSFISSEDWQAAKEATIRLKYWLGIDKAAEERLQELH